VWKEWLEWYTHLSGRQRIIYGLSVSIILLSLPCYCLGVMALITAPVPTPSPTFSPSSTLTATPAVTTSLVATTTPESLSASDRYYIVP
jgi:hypothetical protein